MLGHGPVCEFVGQSQLKELSLKKRLFVTRVRNLTWLGKEACWGQDFDPMIGVDDARSKSDGGNMPFPRGAQAEDETQSAGGRSDWSGCGTMEGLNSAADSKEYSQTK